jgi:hypothetical protein
VFEMGTCVSPPPSSPDYIESFLAEQQDLVYNELNQVSTSFLFQLELKLIRKVAPSKLEARTMSVELGMILRMMRNVFG